ncbi:MAG: hypothetical protein NUV31_06825, partial [Dehalococcoidales bacterium]|nr:hypothetical protein [Dehalococcoidales bacterium]
MALKEKDMFSIWVKTACCNLNSGQLRKLADIAEKYGRGFFLFTTRQIPIIPFIHINQVPEVKQELAEVELELDRCGARVRNLNVCYEDKICPRSICNSISLGEKLEQFFGSQIMHKIKIGVAGCAEDCIFSKVLNDISFVGINVNGFPSYDAFVGGRLGLNPFIGITVARGLSDDQCVKLVQNYFTLLATRGQKGERAADLIQRLGAIVFICELTRDLDKVEKSQIIHCPSRLEIEQTDKAILKIRATCGELTSVQV